MYAMSTLYVRFPPIHVGTILQDSSNFISINIPSHPRVSKHAKGQSYIRSNFHHIFILSQASRSDSYIPVHFYPSHTRTVVSSQKQEKRERKNKQTNPRSKRLLNLRHLTNVCSKYLSMYHDICFNISTNLLWYIHQHQQHS